MNESTGKRQSEINKDNYKTNVTKPKDEKMNPKHDTMKQQQQLIIIIIQILAPTPGDIMIQPNFVS